MKVTTFYSAAIFILGFDVFYCISIPKDHTSLTWQPLVKNKNRSPLATHYDIYGLYSNNPSSTISTAAAAGQPKRLSSTLSNPQDDPYVQSSPSTLTPEVAEILTPDIFTQSDPVLYLLDKVVQLSYSTAGNTAAKLSHPDEHLDKFPPPYLPYAQVLSKLLRFRCDLEDAKKQIENIQRATESRYGEIPAEAFSPEFYGLFAKDVFSDVKPPFQLMTKLMNIPTDKLADLATQLLNKLLRNRRFPYQYFHYAKEVWIYVSNRSKLVMLHRYISELHAYLASNAFSSSSHGSSSEPGTPPSYEGTSFSRIKE